MLSKTSSTLVNFISVFLLLFWYPLVAACSLLLNPYQFSSQSIISFLTGVSLNICWFLKKSRFHRTVLFQLAMGHNSIRSIPIWHCQSNMYVCLYCINSDVVKCAPLYFDHGFDGSQELGSSRLVISLIKMVLDWYFGIGIDFICVDSILCILHTYIYMHMYMHAYIWMLFITHAVCLNIYVPHIHILCILT